MPFSTGNFDRLLDKATSSILLEPDWDATLQLCDAVRAGEVTPKYAASAVTKKVMDKNSNVCLFALSVTESCMKNCGAKFHEELLTQQFLSNLHDLAKKAELPIRNKICSLIQAWDRAFRNESKFSSVKQTYEAMKRDNFTFPETMRESDYMFVSDCAPEWKEDKMCYRCRAEFSTFTRQHHCRHCGQSFCAKCSAKVSTIAKFGIEKEVRVCDNCYDILNKGASNSPNKMSSDAGKSGTEVIKDEDELMALYRNSSLAKEAQTPAPVSREDKLKEEEELQLALAISQSEAEVVGGKSSKNSSSDRAPSPKVKSYSASGKAEDPKSDELAKYMDRSYWEKKRQEQQRQFESEESKTVVLTAPSRNEMVPRIESLAPTGTVSSYHSAPYANGGYVNEDGNETCSLIQNKLDLFLNRMRSNMARGRNISQDSAVQSAFQELSNLQPVLAKMIAANEMKRNHFESQQDQLSLMKDTRETLDSMRDDHQEKLRQEKMEKERQMQLQRQQKMEALRGLKQQFLLHRMQQLESERQNQASMQMQQQFAYNPAQFGANTPPQPQYMSMGSAPMQPAQGMMYGGGAYNMQAMNTALPNQGSVYAHPQFQSGHVPYQPNAYATDYSSMQSFPQQHMAPSTQNQAPEMMSGSYAQQSVGMSYPANAAGIHIPADVNSHYGPPSGSFMHQPNMGTSPGNNASIAGYTTAPPQQQLQSNAQGNYQTEAHGQPAAAVTESPLIDFG